MKTLVKHATVLTVNDRMETYPGGYALVEGQMTREAGAGKCQENCDTMIDTKGGIVVPGMVDTHCHVSMVPFRSMGSDCPDRLRRFLFPLELEIMTPELVYIEARYGICGMLLSDMTTFADMYYFEDMVAKACKELGIRGYLGETVIDQETCDSKTPYGGLDYGETFIKNWKGHRLVAPMVTSHGTSASSPGMLQKACELVVAHDVPWTMHVSEMDYEIAHSRETYQQTPVELLHSQGLLDERLITAHCIHLAERDMELMTECGVKVPHCIGSDTKAGKGVASMRELLTHRIPAGFGISGPSSDNTLGLFTQFRLFASFRKTWNRDRSLFPATEIVRIGTMGGTTALGAKKVTGSIEAGKRTDLVMLDPDKVQMFPCCNPYSLLVRSANPSVVDTAFVDGRILVCRGALICVGLGQMRTELMENIQNFYRETGAYRDMIQTVEFIEKVPRWLIFPADNVKVYSQTKFILTSLYIGRTNQLKLVRFITKSGNDQKPERGLGVKEKKTRVYQLLLLPDILFITFFILIPLLSIILKTFFNEGDSSSPEGYFGLFQSTYFQQVFVRSIKLSLISTLVCAMLGLPTSYYISKYVKNKGVLMALAVFPVFTSPVIRSFSWVVILGKKGTVNTTLVNLGLIPKLVGLFCSEFSMVVGFTQLSLPLMTLSLIGAMDSISEDLNEAVCSLGATGLGTSRHIVFPLSIPGLVTGSVLAFTGCLTAYTTPQPLGGTDTQVLATMIYQQAISLGDWIQASVVAVVIIVVTVVVSNGINTASRELNPTI